MDYKTQIVRRFPGNNTAERSNSILGWLDDQEPKWRELWSGSIPAEMVIRESIGDRQYDNWDTEMTEEAEGFVMEHYLSMSAA